MYFGIFEAELFRVYLFIESYGLEFFCFCFGFSPVWRVCLIPTAIKHLPFLYHEHLRRCLQFFLHRREAGHPTLYIIIYDYLATIGYKNLIIQRE